MSEPTAINAQVDIKDREFEKAVHLVDALLPHKDHWGEDPRNWCFRGVNDAEWRLETSAGREFGKLTVEEKVEEEASLLERFWTMADTQGLAIPASGEAFTALREFKDGKRGPEEWIPDELLHLAALAQHFGVKTRLLDWTRKPLVAAYFAAEKVVHGSDSQHGSESRDGRIAIWILRRPDYRVSIPLRDGRGCVEEVHAPRASNSNLHLQSGILTLFRPAKGEDPYRPLDEMLEHGQVFKWTLPWTERIELLRILDANFVHGATIFSGYAGAMRAAAEHRVLGRRAR